MSVPSPMWPAPLGAGQRLDVPGEPFHDRPDEAGHDPDVGIEHNEGHHQENPVGLDPGKGQCRPGRKKAGQHPSPVERGKRDQVEDAKDDIDLDPHPAEVGEEGEGSALSSSDAQASVHPVQTVEEGHEEKGHKDVRQGAGQGDEDHIPPGMAKIGGVDRDGLGIPEEESRMEKDQHQGKEDRPEGVDVGQRV